MTIVINNLIPNIINWIKDYATNNKFSTLVIGISGGVDSSVVSTLCAKTNLNTIVVSMPIKQIKKQHSLSIKHGEWLGQQFNNVNHQIIDLSDSFKNIQNVFTKHKYDHLHSLANTRARLRMLTLYQVAGSTNGLVVGTGNKVEDFGVGFYTKYGDGGVDISPIGDCLKTQVWDMAKKLNINKKIINAKPTDGLWDDGRTDEDQLKGLNYKKLERAMMISEQKDNANLDSDEKKLLKKYISIRNPNMHKMKPIPVYKLKT
jgi:NAD+ synthase